MELGDDGQPVERLEVQVRAGDLRLFEVAAHRLQP
ncbi:hypothetical protein SBBP2_300003 [Burkholderiales bacterium]|nr:hypothetical protein SBBP2_300003 [Burkholderiales bacterium]